MNVLREEWRFVREHLFTRPKKRDKPAPPHEPEGRHNYYEWSHYRTADIDYRHGRSQFVFAWMYVVLAVLGVVAFVNMVVALVVTFGNLA